MALRHQIGVLQRSARKLPKLTPADRLFWVFLSRVWGDWRSALAIVQPETVITWNRKGFRLFWTWKIRHGQGGSARCPTRRTRTIRATPQIFGIRLVGSAKSRRSQQLRGSARVLRKCGPPACDEGRSGLSGIPSAAEHALAPSAQGVPGHLRMPNRRPRRTPRKVRPLFPSEPCVQLPPQSRLPEVPVWSPPVTPGLDT